MLGNDATEFLKTLYKLDDIWSLQEEAEYNERQLVQFAERYHQSKVKENELLHSVVNCVCKHPLYEEIENNNKIICIRCGDYKKK
jgi:hypothetical protein